MIARPSADWIARQLTEAYGWQQTPRYIVRDRDRVYGDILLKRLRAMGIRDRPISPKSPWQNGYSERLIGSIRRDCLDHVVVFGERHLRHLLNSYQKYYNQARTHLSLHKDAPIPRAVQTEVARWRCQFWADCTTNISGRKFPTGTAAYLTAGEIFPLEIRALAIAFFFAIGTGIGGVVSPWWFANFINEGRESLYLGFIVLLH